MFVIFVRVIVFYFWRYLGSYWVGGEGRLKLQGGNLVEKSLRECKGFFFYYFDVFLFLWIVFVFLMMIVLEDVVIQVFIGDVVDKIKIKYFCYKYRNMVFEFYV